MQCETNDVAGLAREPLDVVHQLLHEEQPAMVFALEMLGRRGIHRARREIEARPFVGDLDDEMDVRDTGVHADALARMLGIAVQDGVGQRLGEGHGNVEPQLMFAKLHQFTLAADELHYSLDLADVAGDFQLHDAGGW